MKKEETNFLDIKSFLCDITSVILSNPKKGNEYKKIRIYKNTTENNLYFCEFFTETQVFHKTKTIKELELFIIENFTTAFKNTLITTPKETISLLTNKKGKTVVLRKEIKNTENNNLFEIKNPNAKKKNYILPENTPVPFLVHLGVMTETGKVVASKYDKFRQINRFLEFINDILPKETEKPYRVLDFGCGKSYLTFALYHFLSNIRKKKVYIVGIDIKEEVIKKCSTLAKTWGYEGLSFQTGRIEDYKETSYQELDLVISLHACDTATDYALAYAVKQKAKAILAVPCCQHELNAELKKDLPNKAFGSFMKHGIIKERFSALATDVMRAELLEEQGYSVQLMEFIDMEHTAKNILIRAIKKTDKLTEKQSEKHRELCKELEAKIILEKLLRD